MQDKTRRPAEMRRDVGRILGPCIRLRRQTGVHVGKPLGHAPGPSWHGARWAPCAPGDSVRLG